MPSRKEMSLKELRNEVESRKADLLSELRNRRDDLEAALSYVDQEIASLSGGASPSGGTGKKPGRKMGPRKTAKKAARTKAPRRSIKKAKKKASKKASRSGGGRRASGETLQDYLVSVLKEADGPMRVKDAVAAVRDAGYPTNSKDFYGIVASGLRDTDKFEKVGRGLYKLK